MQYNELLFTFLGIHWPNQMDLKADFFLHWATKAIGGHRIKHLGLNVKNIKTLRRLVQIRAQNNLQRSTAMQPHTDKLGLTLPYK